MGAYDDSNRTLQSAEARLNELQVQINVMQNRSLMAQEAGRTVGSVWMRVNISSIGWQAAGLNSAPLQAKLNQAQGLLSTDPQEAMRLAREVNETANLQDAQVQGRGSALGWVGLLIGAVAVVGIGAWLLFKHRPKRKGL
ncbi:Uncharacterised protein [uncultured archaeon]|nr:Uncharacterised protein [uncultured archaeon]